MNFMLQKIKSAEYEKKKELRSLFFSLWGWSVYFYSVRIEMIWQQHKYIIKQTETAV